MVGTGKRRKFLWTGSADGTQPSGRLRARMPQPRPDENDMVSTPEPPEKMMFQLSLRRRGISDQTILRAMEEGPHEGFVTAADRGNAYRDSALGIACGLTTSHPFLVAYMPAPVHPTNHTQ